MILYKLSKRYYSPSEFTALVVAALFPIGKSGFELIYHRQLDPISILVLLGIGADSVALLFGGSPRLLLVRESLITGVFGLACFFSLLLPRPMMFYFRTLFHCRNRSRAAGTIQCRRQFPEVRFCHRLITTVWGCAFVGELVVRIVLIYNLPAALVLVISPILIGVLTISTMVWAFAYGHRVRLRVMARFEQTEQAAKQV